MKSPTLLATLLCVPFLLVASLQAGEKEKEAIAKTQKPSLTYYFFDG